MKRITAAFIILILTICISIGSYFYIVQTSKKMILLFKEDKAVTVSTGETSSLRVQKIQDEWEKHESLMVAILPHSELDSIEIGIMSLKDYHKQELNEEYIKVLDECVNRFRHISESEKPDFKSIF